MSNLLFEIGVEEIPARFLPHGKVQLEENFKKITSEYRISLFAIKVFVTPRRLTIIADLSEEQEPEEKLIWGPPAHIAFNESGEPKEPALAFAKAQGINVKDLRIEKKGKGNYVCALLKEKGKKTEEVLPEILKSLFTSITFPKMMRWGNGSLKFVRPVRWFLAIYKDRVIPFEIDGIKAGEYTQGHRFLSKNPLKIDKISNYEKILESAFVIVDQNKRKSIIISQADSLANKVNGKIFWDEELLDEVTNLVEYPEAVLCSFSEAYLTLPKELLITVMKDHQRYFSITDTEGKLKNYFVVIGNTKLENEENIRKGAERVIKARFEDAKFYYEEDLKKGFERLLEGTKGIIYHKKLGSLYDKVLRINRIAIKLANTILPEKIELIELASRYCKADISSGVVGEFPELQGIMGGYYAKHAGFPEEVAQAIREHYLPKGFTDEIPSNDLGCIISIADKLDHISSFFYLGEIPSGTEDPFGLRRAANAVLAILLKRKYPLSMGDILSALVDFISEEVKEQISTFISQRFESFLEMSGYDINLIKTISELILTRPLYEIEERLKAVNEFKNSDNFEGFFLAVKRVSNIIRNYEKVPFNRDLLVASEEKELYISMEETRKELTEYLKNERFIDALHHLDRLTPIINNFFDRVLVMDKDESIKRNRIALLQELSEILKSVADISKLY
ncbi:MAG: glycine--tRNA ligase subunit beta [Thermodesulfovibrio sp.]|nr:glycine--tRNA ligase subunit beta [Thermodesulfovibrio sp.]